MKDVATLAILLAPIIGLLIMQVGDYLAHKYDALERLEREGK